jgi:hypothetical protein
MQARDGNEDIVTVLAENQLRILFRINLSAIGTASLREIG